ncbi:MAG: PAS domain S-box protein [Candidatus Hodarchaeales archaeon]
MFDFINDQTNDLEPHLCNIFRDNNEQFSVLTSFVLSGLRNNEKCLVILDNHKKEKVLKKIQNSIEFKPYFEKNQIEFSSTEEFFTEGERFNSYQSLLKLKEKKNQSISQGFTRLRIVSEMSWTLLNATLISELFIFEKYINELCMEDNCTFLDQFQQNKSNYAIISKIYAVHHTVILGTEIINKTVKNTSFLGFNETDSNFSNNNHDSLTTEYTPEFKKVNYGHIWKMIYQSKKPGLIIGKEGRIIDYNASMVRMTGYYPDNNVDIYSWFAKIVLNEKNQDSVLELIESSKDQQFGSSKCEVQIQSMNGEIKYVEFTIYTIYHNGTPTDLQVLQGLDVTSKREKEMHILMQAQLLENLQESLIALNLDNKIIYWGKGAEKLYGYQPEEVLGSQITFIVPALEKEKEIKKIQKVATNNSWKGQCRQIKKDGTIFWAGSRISVVKDKNGTLCGFLRTDVDISRYKQIEEDLSLSEQKFRNIYNSNPLGMLNYQLMADGRLVFIGANRAADEILGVDTRQFIGKTIEDSFPSLVTTDIPDKYREVAKTGMEYRVEQIAYEDAQIKGVYQVVAFQTEPMKMVASFWDITPLKTVEEERSNLLTVVSHELRTPLMIIQGSTEFLKKHFSKIDDEVRVKCLNTILRNTARLECLAFEVDRWPDINIENSSFGFKKKA